MREGKPFKKGSPLSRSPLPKSFYFFDMLPLATLRPPAAGWPLDRSEVETRATALFTAWGGMDLLRAVLPDYC